VSGVVTVRLWGTAVGYLGYEPGQTEVATFEFDAEFVRSGIQLSPIAMRHPPAHWRFDAISRRTFRGVPGIIADALPDKFGNQLIDAFLADRGKTPADITTLDRLLHVGDRAMGALEFEPHEDMIAAPDPSLALDLEGLAALAGEVTARRKNLHEKLLGAKTRARGLRLIQVGSSAGGARAKALVAQTPDGQLLDGTVDQGPGARYWLLKFDVANNSDRDGKDPKGMTRVEYIYSQIARELGLDMPEVAYIADGDDFHFMSERFDRTTAGGKFDKLHYASWCGLAHADRDTAGAYSYEQLVQVVRQMELGQGAVTEIFRRAVLNVVGRNQDDHTKNFGFLMDRRGEWRLAPAFDVTYAYDPTGLWTRAHQIRLNRKQDDFSWEDILAFGRFCNLREPKIRKYTEATVGAMSQFEQRARHLGVDATLSRTVAEAMRLHVGP
jgi:serine/threonine-protein kinase HipA